MISNGECLTTDGSSLARWSNVGNNFSATQVQIEYRIDPFSSEGQKWIKRLRLALASHFSTTKWYLSGEGPNQMDAADITFRTFPLMIGLMMVVVLVFIGVAFRSVVAPLRSVFCLAWLLIMTFGLAIFTFQDGWLSFLNWSQVEARSSGAMNWMSPCIAFSVIVGLGLDYDIFYTEHFMEERQRGHDDKEAAVRALTATANIISAAGIVMVIAFLPMILCTIPTLNEIGFLLIVAVLISCFIATKVTIPASVAVLGKRSVLPTKDAELDDNSR